MIKNASHVVKEVFGVKEDEALSKENTNNFASGINPQGILVKQAFGSEQELTATLKQSRAQIKEMSPKSQQVQQRREEQLQIGFKRVGFVDDLSSTLLLSCFSGRCEQDLWGTAQKGGKQKG